MEPGTFNPEPEARNPSQNILPAKVDTLRKWPNSVSVTSLSLSLSRCQLSLFFLALLRAPTPNPEPFAEFDGVVAMLASSCTNPTGVPRL